MKRAAGVVLGLLVAVAPVGVGMHVAFADEGSDPPGWARACSHESPQEHNKHCQGEAAGGPAPGSGAPQEPPAAGNDSGPTTSDRAADCAADRTGDGDPWPDGCDLGDHDADGVPNQFDNCPTAANNDQSDRDADGIGDRCDPYPDDADHDGVADDRDNCSSDANGAQTDRDRDGIGDACDGDQGNNGVPDDLDPAYAEAHGAVTGAVDTVVGSLPAP